MTQGELDYLRESCLFPSRIQTGLSEASETIMSAHSGEVDFYEVAFSTSLHFPLYPIIRRIWDFYTICPT